MASSFKLINCLFAAVYGCKLCWFSGLEVLGPHPSGRSLFKTKGLNVSPNPLLRKKFGVVGFLLIICCCAKSGIYGESVSPCSLLLTVWVFLVH